MQKVLITGATGLVGSHLAEHLTLQGYNISTLTRKVKANSKFNSFSWDPSLGTIDETALDGVDYIIHLAGSNIMEKKWTDKRKAQIISSRTESTKLLVEAIKKNNTKLKAFISASAIGYYGSRTLEKVFEETDAPHTDFLSESCQLWEASSEEVEQLNIRRVYYRIGVVLAAEGGALTELTKPVSLGVGTALGTGKQYMPWIHIDDLCQLFLEAIKNDKIQGPYNAVAPEPMTNESFTKLIASTLRKPLWLPKAPALFLKLILGERATLILEGSRVSSHKIISTGFRFKFNTVKSALVDLLIK